MSKESVKYIYSQIPYLEGMNEQDMDEQEKLLNKIISFLECGAKSPKGEVTLKDMFVILDVEHLKIVFKAMNIHCEKDLYQVGKTFSIIDGEKGEYDV